VKNRPKAGFAFCTFSKTNSMTEQNETGQDIELVGKSGTRYAGKIYADKNSTSGLSGRAIACLSNSAQTEQGWQHKINSIYNTESISGELSHFRDRDDISHLILLPYTANENGPMDKVDDLIRSYIHQ
jgi:hypothetical protein